MKKLKFLLIIMVGVLLIPFSVFSFDNETTETDDTTQEVETTEGEEDSQEVEKVHVYFFRGDGCSYCAAAEEYFDSIQDEYGQYFDIIDYETWYDDDNAELLQKVADARNEEVEGVPYIIIGNQSWNGFTEEIGEEMKQAIVDEYNTDPTERYDIMQLVESGATQDNDYSDDVMILILIVLVAAGVVAGVVYARKRTA